MIPSCVSWQGNCKSSDATRGRWCYVRGNYCDDIQYSKNRRDEYGQLRKWSYQGSKGGPLVM